MLTRIPLYLLALTAPAWALAEEPADQGKPPAAAVADPAPDRSAQEVSAEVAAPEATAKDGAAPPDAPAEEGPRTLSGMSILGNEEAPKALVIVPWKTSELGASLSLSDTLDDRARPVDREVFMREIDYYGLRSGE